MGLRWILGVVATACGRLGFDERGFEARFEFTTPADYVFDPALVTVEEGLARPIALDLADDEAAEFGAGTFSNTSYGDGLGLDTSSGGFRSRIFDAGRSTSWRGLRWTPDAPYRKNLLDGGGLETGYLADGLDMTGSVLLLHLDELTAPDGAIVRDDARGASGTLTTGDSEDKAVPGMFGWGLAFDGADDVATLTDTAGLDDITLDVAHVTWSMWARRTSDASGTILYKSDRNGARGWWIDYRSMTQDIGIAYVCPMGNTRKYTTSLPPIGQWFHLAITYDGTNGAPAAFRFFIDGVEITTFRQADGCGAGHTSDAGIPLMIGRGLDGATETWAGDLDELAIWNRVLSDAEIGALHRRGVRRLGLRLRACELADCADAPAFVGGNQPDGTLVDGPIPDATVSTPVIGRFAQYELEMSTVDTLPSPRVRRVELRRSATDLHISNAIAVPFRSLSAFEVTPGPDSESEIKFQLSRDGERWLFWRDGWIEATTAADANPASEIAAHVAELSGDPGDALSFRALLEDGVALDRVVVRGLR